MTESQTRGFDHPRGGLQTTKDWLQIIALFCGLVWGVTQFYEKEIVLPSKRPATVTVRPSLEQVKSEDRFARIRASVHLTNNSDSRVYVLGLWYTVMGIKLGRPNLADSEFERRVAEYAKQVGGAVPEFANVARYAATDSEVVIAAWKEPVHELWLDPNEEDDYQNTFVVPLFNYQAVALNVEYVVMRSNSFLAGTQWVATGNGSLAMDMKIKDAGFERDSLKFHIYDAFKNPADQQLQTKYGVADLTSRVILVLTQ